MNYEVIMFVVAFVCSGALVTVYILWLAGLFSKRPTQQSDTEKIKKYIESLDVKQLARVLQEVADGIQRAEKNSDKPLTKKEKQFIAFHQLCHEMVKDERTYNVAKDWVINDRIIKEMEED